MSESNTIAAGPKLTGLVVASLSLLVLLLLVPPAGAAVLTSLEVVERVGLARPAGVVEAGIPLARGSVASPPVLDLRDAADPSKACRDFLSRD